MAFDRIRPLRAHERVAEQLRAQIALRHVQPGEALPAERELAAMFGVGRPTVREALRQLERERLVEARRGRTGGTFVLVPGEDPGVMEQVRARLLRRRDELAELLEYRRHVEPLVTAVAAEKRTEEDLARIGDLLEKTSAALDQPLHMRFDTQFHIAIAVATQNRWFRETIERTRVHLNDVLGLLPRGDARNRRFAAEHEAIRAGVLQRDPDAAAAAAEQHLATIDRAARSFFASLEDG